jgi:serine/threonine protein kinase/formylglycine-generating enzyme required for sulfatase activity
VTAAEDSSQAFSPPTTFEEYRLLHLLGRGAMGQVFLAEDRLLDRLIAIKFIGARSPTQAARERLFAEARAIARLQHPNVVTVYRVSEVLGRPFLVSEYVRGRSLDQIEMPVPWTKALAIGIDLARGLAAAHRRGVLHRDIKPANAVIAEDGTVKLLDFGLAELMPSGDALDERTAAARHLPEDAAIESTIPVSQTSPDLLSTTDAPPTHSGERRVSGAIAGTPLYMAPEIFRGEPATPRSDIYSLGVLLFELCAGHPPIDGRNVAELRERVLSGEAPRLAAVVQGIEPRFAAAVDRCLRPAPRERYPSAEALLEELNGLSASSSIGLRAVPEGNPYRGLLPFEAEHRGVFFGRDAEIRSILERLRSQRFVLVAGDSGVGKSSICRAGVLASLSERQDGSGEVLASLVPGKKPLESLAGALAGVAEAPDLRDLIERLRADPASLARKIRLKRPSSPLIFIDQLEELHTLADPEAAVAFCEALRSLVEAGAVRILATARSDFLGRLSALGGILDDLSSLYLLRPLTIEGLREAIVGPARSKGFSFEPEAMIEALAEEAKASPGGLPLLEFALSELWERRDEASHQIHLSALDAMGGLGGALARRADEILMAMPPAEHEAARSILLLLISEEGTRGRLAERDIVESAGPSAPAALLHLVRGRLLVARTEEGGESAYEIAHEALLAGWDTLRGWRGHDAEENAKRQKLSRAAAEWARLGRSRDALFQGQRLAAMTSLEPATLGALEREFLLASRRAARRRTLLTWGAVASVPLAATLTAGGMRLHAAREIDRQADQSLREAEREREQGGADAKEAARLRQEAFQRFDARESALAEEHWSSAQKKQQAAERSYARASQVLEAGLAISGGRADLRVRLADTLYERALLREQERRFEERDELINRLSAYDDGGSRRARLSAPAILTIESSPAGATVWISRYEARDGKRIEGESELLGTTPLGDKRIAPGSIVLHVEAPGTAKVRLPVLLGRQEARTIKIALLPPASIPEGFVYIPEGTFLVGSDEDDTNRIRNERQPLHPAATAGFFIARHEVTFADWLRYLRALPEEERAARTPKLNDEFHELRLSPEEGGRYRLTLKPGGATYSALEGEKLRYPGRTRRVEQDWTRMPVAGISYADALAYAAFMSDMETPRGARLCGQMEWERAAKGADDRVFPHGDRLEKDDANWDKTYDQNPQGFGPDEVGSHPASVSPFGVLDMAGNVWELTAPFGPSGPPVGRGGSFFQPALDARTYNFHELEQSLRSALVGLRLCATPPPSAP